jgi:hypothetical protein
MLRDETEKKMNQFFFQTKQIAIKRKRTKFDIKINQNQMLRDEIKNKIQLKKDKKRNK